MHRNLKKTQIQQPTTLEFWNSVADIYESSNMTHHKADQELDFVNNCIKNELTELVCLGAADGCRDPMKILEYLKKNNLNYPKYLTVDDLSPKLLDVCAKRLDELNINISTKYIAAPINKLEDFVTRNYFKTLVLYGVYDADFIHNALAIYEENKQVIGETFTCDYLSFESNRLYYHKGIKFHISDRKKYITTIDNIRSANTFLAYSICTNTGFISHYYDIDGLKKFNDKIFGLKHLSTQKIGKRYIVCKIGSTKYERLVTILNNVIGNIPWNDLTDSLKVIDRLYL